MEDKPVNRVTAAALSQALGTFISVIVEWMSHYAFEPVGVEVAFGGKEPRIPAWELELSSNSKMVFNGIIDRVDFSPEKTNLHGHCD
jgi:ATP-dependent helicase/DNAse subunit B